MIVAAEAADEFTAADDVDAAIAVVLIEIVLVEAESAAAGLLELDVMSRGAS